MSANLPLRTIRIPALRQQCRFRYRAPLPTPRAFSTTTPQALGVTSPRLSRAGGSSNKLMVSGAAKQAGQPSPEVLQNEAGQEGEMIEDIGLLQDTLVRANWKSLPPVWDPAFWSYWYKVLKNKISGLYSRSVYKRCMYKQGILRFLPVDAFNNGQTLDLAKKLHVQLYEHFASRRVIPLSKICLPPLARSFAKRIDARRAANMSWQRVALHSARVVSHRAVTFGEDQPDSAIRQVVVRLVSTQAFNIAHSTGAPRHTSRTSSVRSAQGLPWIPDEVKNLKKNQARSEDPRAEVSGRVVEAVKGQPEKVVEYLVLQKRVLNGAEDSTWKIWGFAEESTPERLLSDAQYWSKTLDAHTA